MFYLATFLICMLVQEAGGSNILFFYFPTFSHIRGSLHVASELVARGHVVWNALPNDLANDKRLQVPGVNTLAYNALDNVNTEASVDEEIDNYFETGKINFDFTKYMLISQRVLEDERMIKRMVKINFDLVILDALPLARLLTMLPYKLGVPFIFIGACYEPYASRSPYVMSTFPYLVMPWSPRMDFQTRLLNTLIMSSTWFYDPFSKSGALAEYAPEKPYLSMEALTAKGSLWLVELEPLLHYPQALLPNVKFIGSLSATAPKKLPEIYQRFCDEAKQGIVIVSFGSNVKRLPKLVFDRLIQAFSQTNYRYIVRSDENKNIGSNIMLTTWMPQNDLLAHPKTKLFITHCGANGQNEAFLSGVPMIGFPIFAEQHFNAEKLVYKGFGKSLNFRTFEVDELVSSINEVIHNDSYSKNIKKTAKITAELRERSPQDEAVYWIEHVIQYGGDHLRSYCQDMPLYQYLNIDVIALLVAVVHLCLYIIWKLCCCCLRCKTKGKVKKD